MEKYWYIEKKTFRKIYSFKYFNKYFKCWELLVGHILRMENNFEDTINSLLLEYNKKIPNLNERQTIELTKFLFWWENLMDTLKKDDKKDKIRDFHITIWRICKELWIDYFSVLNMSFEDFRKICDDLMIILWHEKYDKNRKNNTSDLNALKKDFKNYYYW